MFTAETIASLALLIAVAITLVIILMKRRKPPKKRRLPPGPFCWPILGNFPQVLIPRNKPLVQIALEWREKYGNIFQMKLGAVRLIWICGFELAKEVLIHKGNKFDSRPNWMTVVRETRQNEGILYNSGETYRQLKLLLQTATTENGIHNEGNTVEHQIMQEVYACIKEMETIADNGTEAKLDSLMSTCFMNLLYANVFGKRSECDDSSARLRNWNQLISEIKSLNKIFHLTDFIPCSSILPFSKINPKLLEKLSIARKLIKEEISKHRKTFNLRSPSDLIDLYIDAKKKGTDISETNLFCLILDTFCADTNREALLWIIALIVSHQDVQNRCRHEIAQVIGKDVTVRSDDMQRLPYTCAIISEALRLKGKQTAYPHANFKDVKLADYHIPKHSVVLVNLASIHLDPRLWDDPLKFRPDRFIDINGALKRIDHFCPYGMGSRKCTLWQTSEKTLFLFVANIIRKFQFVLPKGQETIDLTGEQKSFHLPVTPKSFNVKIDKLTYS